MRTVKSILDELQRELGIKEKVRVEIKPMKSKAASVSLRTGVIRLNKHAMDSGELCIKYLLLHELAHLKLGRTTHGDDFYRVVYSVMSPDEVEECEKKVIQSLKRRLIKG